MVVSIKELVKNLESLPVYQRKDAELAYSGQKIVWELKFRSIRDGKDSLSTVLAFGPNSYPWVYFNVDLDKYPEFKLMHNDTKIIVTATIDSVSGPDVNLRDVEKIGFTSDSKVDPSAILEEVGNSRRYTLDKSVENSTVKKEWYEKPLGQIAIGLFILIIGGVIYDYIKGLI